ncbi:Gfo/Idh/MocA family protein [Nonomuraea sp. NPDC050536]|uniref:Gfo/Idh/MocA family protein n=1 Tax=Nonomuraea sp. NPDC050536 TaxID=3364366 RepID=UPI0037C796B6
MSAVGVGVIGAGVISDTYLKNLMSFPDLNVRFVADLDLERAKVQAGKYGVAGAGSVDQLLADDDVEIVVNLTIPAAHVEVGLAALASGKHVWTEKPLALDRAGGRALLDRAAAAGLRVACAPDTVLGAGFQTTRRAVAEGRIGTPLTALTLFQTPGPEVWHPSPEFLFQAGGGPLMDMGPYYLTGLVQLLGPVRRVFAAGGRARDRREIGSGPRAGTTFEVSVPTTVTALVTFESGASAQVLLTFDSGLARTGFFEVTGSLGTAVVPDPNRFDGQTALHLLGAGDPVALTPHGHTAQRGTGALELARAIRAGVPERASGELAFHVLDTMLSIDESLTHGEPVEVASTVDIPPPLPADWNPHDRTL